MLAFGKLHHISLKIVITGDWLQLPFVSPKFLAVSAVGALVLSPLKALVLVTSGVETLDIHLCETGSIVMY